MGKPAQLIPTHSGLSHRPAMIPFLPFPTGALSGHSAPRLDDFRIAAYDGAAYDPAGLKLPGGHCQLRSGTTPALPYFGPGAGVYPTHLAAATRCGRAPGPLGVIGQSIDAGASGGEFPNLATKRKSCRR